jgi:hypothetical protein
VDRVGVVVGESRRGREGTERGNGRQDGRGALQASHLVPLIRLHYPWLAIWLASRT